MRIWLALISLILAGCAKEPAAYLVNGNDVAITVERIQPYFWSTGWELDVILRQHPNCQRRHHLKPTTSANVKVEVFSPEPAVYILRQGKRWYVVELRTCGFEAYKDAPPEPGELVGAFQVKGGVFRFVPSADSGKGGDSANGE